MCSRIRKSANNVFEAFFEISPSTANTEPTIVYKFPHSFIDEEIIKFVPQFSFPCCFTPSTVLHYSFVLTSIDSKWTFGYCRHSPDAGHNCFVLLSSLPWHDAFYKILNHIYSLTCKDKLFLTKFLEALYEAPIPEPGVQLKVLYYVHAKEYEFSAQCPDHRKLPTIPEDRNLSEFYNAVDSNNMIVVFASMLNERRILITSKKLSRLSACVQAANTLIYPMHWQHIFIPVLPTSLLDYLSAPMPFLIGVPSATMTRVKQSELGEVVILDADSNKIESPFNDVQTLPTDIVSFLKKNLRNTNLMVSDGVARTFLKALVMLIGGYRDALHLSPGEKISFNKQKFITSRPPPLQPFLERMLHLQLFQQFIEGRLAMLNDGEGFGDEFEIEVNMYEDRSSNRLRTQYREWMGAMKKEGGAIFKSVNPAMKSAYKQVKDKGKIVKDKSKQAYKDIRSKMQKPGHSGDDLPRSAPSSPRGSIDGINIEKEKLSGDLRRRGGVKKSMSGVFTQTEKTMVYLRNKADLRNNTAVRNLYMNGMKSNSGHLLEAPTSNGFLAPEASSEDSDVDICSSGEDYKYKPINMDLMSDMHDILFKRCSVDPANTTKISTNALIEIENNSSGKNCTPILAPPIAPPRNSHRLSDNQAEQANLLIELDSPPDDVNTLFDPLLEAKSTSNEQCRTQPVRSNVKLSGPSIPNSAFLLTSLDTTPASNLVNYSGFQSINPVDNRQSALLLSSSKSYNSNPTNPFVNNTNVNSCHLTNERNIVNENTHNPFNRNWQQFE